jgi:Ni,Fe-hydrogenase III small subunit/ferredoxin-like protein FixX
MSSWFKKGLKTGIVTTKYPKIYESEAGITPGFPKNSNSKDVDSDALISLCPTDALYNSPNNTISLERERCIHCFRCCRSLENPMPWDKGYEWGTLEKNSIDFSKEFHHSINIRVVDAGDCGACLNEIKMLNNPYYNMHRLGFFITPTPRKADILLVVGPVTKNMKTALIKTYEAMPTPKKVMAVGTCALSGGLFKDGFVTDEKLSDILPVDLTIAGCPPPPLAIIHGLLVLSGRKNSYKKVQND